MKRKHGLTMGRLIGSIEGIDELGHAFKERVDGALASRNYQAHDFWRDRAEEFEVSKQYSDLCKELKSYAELFESVGKGIHEALRANRQKLGLNDEVIEEKVNKEIQKLKDAV
jgi:hypothetical protein